MNDELAGMHPGSVERIGGGLRARRRARPHASYARASRRPPARRRPRSSRCRPRRRSPGSARSRGASAPGAARRRSGRCRRRPTSSWSSSAGTSSSNRNLRSCSCSQSASRLSRPSWRSFISASPSGFSARAPSRSRGRMLDVLAELLVVLEVELVLAGLLDRHRELEAVLLGQLRDVASRTARRPARRRPSASTPRSTADLHALEDQPAWRRGSSRSPPASGRPRSRTSSSGRTPGGRRPGCRASRRSRAPWPLHLRVLVRARHWLPSARRMEPNFSGPSYTLGIEEELMILDARDAGLVNAIERLLEDSDRDGEIKPELHGVGARDRHAARARTSREAGDAAARRCAARSPRPPARTGLRIGSAGTHPFARWEDQRISARRALPRPGQRAALRRPPGDHLRAARARRARRRRQGDPRRQRHARARPDPARAVGQLAVLARRRRPACASTRMPIFRAFPRVGIPPDYAAGPTTRAGSASWSRPA